MKQNSPCNSLSDYAELGHFALLFSRRRQRNVLRFITHMHSYRLVHQIFSFLTILLLLSLWFAYAPYQRSKLTFSKSHLLATFNCKMVAIKRNSVTKKTWKGRTLYDILHKGLMCRTAHFYHFALLQ